MIIHFAYPWMFFVGLSILAAVACWRWHYSSRIVYRYPCIAIQSSSRSSLIDLLMVWVPSMLYVAVALLLVLALARPRKPDERTQVNIDGIGIMLVLDVSQSMLCFDNPTELVSRFACAQEEAIRFINRRPQDVFGLVLFGRIAATRCPLTIDHRMLTALIRSTKIGIIPDDETSLAQAIIMGIRRLQASPAKNNIMVLLTDGEPSEADQALLPDAMALAQKSSIKIYTIGIGSPEGGFIHHPLMGMVQVSSCFRPDILRYIAQKTGGAAFEARNQKELAEIYGVIDRLETSTQQEPVYAQWCEYYVYAVIVALILLVIAWGMAAWLVIL
jgi:Ca-activated chloride channel family protein